MSSPESHTQAQPWWGRASSIGLLAGVSLAAAALLVVGLSTRKIWTVEYWWLWKTGEYVAKHGIPRTDVFSYTDFGVPRIEVRWGYAWFVYLITTAFGHAAAGIARTLVVLGMFACAACSGPVRKAPVLTAAVIMVAALAASQRFYIRPETVSYLFFAGFILLIECARQRRTRWIYLLPPLQILWSNIHGVFILGPVLCGAWFTSELIEWIWRRMHGTLADSEARWRLTTSGLLILITLGASVVNPFGLELLTLPILQFSALHGTAQKELLVELTSPFAFDQDWIALFYYKLLIALAVGSMLLNLRRQRVFWLILVGSQLYLSTTAIRNLPFFCLVAAPFAVRNLHESAWIARLLGVRGLGMLRPAAAVVLVTFTAWQWRELVTNRFNIQQGDTNQFGLGIAHHHYPIEATAFLKSSGATGQIFNTLAFGSYLIAEDVPVFVDPRAEEHMYRVFAEYRELLDQPGAFDRYAGQYDFAIVMLQTDMLPQIDAMRARPNWRMVYADDVAVLFFRNDVAPQIAALDPAHDGGQWFERVSYSLGEPPAFEKAGFLTKLVSPVPYNRLAGFAFSMGLYQFAGQLFEQARLAYPPAFTEQDALAFCLAAQDKHEEAASLYEVAIERAVLRREQAASSNPVELPAIDRDLRNLQLRLAASQLNLGRTEPARQAIAPLLNPPSDDGEVLAMMGLIELVDRRGDQSEHWLRKALAIDPGEAAYHKYLAQALFLQGRLDDAVDEFEASWQLKPGDFEMARDIAGLLIQTNRVDDALTWLDRAASIRPEDPAIVQMRTRLADQLRAPK